MCAYRPQDCLSSTIALALHECNTSRVQELSLLYDAFLPYGYSTVATACLVLAEWTVKGNAGPAASSQAGSAAPAIRTVAALTELAGVDVAALAPNLAPCVEALHQLYAQATAPGPDGASPSAAKLGLLSPVVARYVPSAQR